MKHDMSGELLTISLAAAVPLRIDEYKKRGGPTDADRERASAFAPDLGAKGDILMYGGGKKGEVAELFNRLSDGIAVLSFAPGGVHLFGMHFESTVPVGATQAPDGGAGEPV